MRRALLSVTALASEYCMAVENASESEREDFVASVIRLLPRLYIEFTDIQPEVSRMREDDFDEETEFSDDPDMIDPDALISLEDESAFGYYGASYVDDDYYESVRRHIESLLGPDDTFLETFEEDMKYSDTPIAASVSECLADIFKPLYNFISIVRDTDGEKLTAAYRDCHDSFVEYWSQKLCNVMRALNHIRYSQDQI